MDLFKGLRGYRGFKLRGWVSPYFSATLAAKVLEVQERGTCSMSSIIMPSLVELGSPAAMAAKNVEILSAVVCPSHFVG